MTINSNFVFFFPILGKKENWILWTFFRFFFLFLFHYIPPIPTPIHSIPTHISQIPTHIPRILTLIARIPTLIPLIPFPDSPPRLLQIAHF